MKCMVIDGNSIINRAYYGIRPLTNREGLYTHAVFGFLTTLLRLKEEERPDALCVTFDLHAPTFRHKADEAYKATRKPMPEELRMQVPVLKEVLDTLNIPRYEMEGWEADDLIGTISRKCEAAGWDCVVVTGDKDSLQLITDHTKVKLVSTRMGQTTTKDMTPETFREQYGFEPIHMIDLKALMGDTSDNIPGVPGVGEKTAMDLIQKYGSVGAIYEKLPDIDTKPAAIKKLTAGEDAARHSYWLATIVTDAPLSFDPAENRVQEPTPAAYPLFLKLEFSKLIEKMGLRPEETAPADAAPDVTVTAERITEESRAREVLELFRKADHVTVLALPDLSGVIADCDTGADTALSAEFFFERYTGDWNALLNALFAADIKKVSHNVKDLMRTLLENGLNAEGFVFDTALAAYLVDATSGKYEIGQLFAGYFHTELVKPVHLEPDAFSLLGDVTAAEAAFHSYTSAVDALYGVLAPKLKELDLWDLYATAAQVFHVAPGDVTHEMRRRAKAVNFGIVYGISAFSLSQDIGVTVAEAKAYMEAYFATFPGVRKYMDDVVAKAKEQGYVETLFHRRRELPEIRSSNFNMRSFGERVALNMPIQGTAADIMKLAMVAVEKRLKRELPEAKLVLQVHDELIVECPKPQAAAAAKLLEEEMEQAAHLSVPLTAEAHWGRNWLEAKG